MRKKDIYTDSIALHHYSTEVTKSLSALPKTLKDSMFFKNTIQILCKTHIQAPTWDVTQIVTPSTITDRLTTVYASIEPTPTTLAYLLAKEDTDTARALLRPLITAQIQCDTFKKLGVIFYMMQDNPSHPMAQKLQKEMDNDIEMELFRLSLKKMVRFSLPPSDQTAQTSAHLTPAPAPASLSSL